MTRRTYRIAVQQPYDWEAILSWLASRAIPNIETVAGGVYHRDDATVRWDGDAIVVRTNARADLAHARRLFDVDADPNPIAATLSRDRMLAPLLRRRPGVRVPGAWDPFELAVRAIVGQQVSVAAARTILGRIAEAHGLSPQRLAQTTITGMPAKRAESIRALATAVASGALKLERQASLEESIAMLRTIPGVGPWTAHYIAMRALGERDAFPAGDLILRRNAGNLSERELLARAESWRPFRAYAAMLLWTRPASP